MWSWFYFCLVFSSAFFPFFLPRNCLPELFCVFWSLSPVFFLRRTVALRCCPIRVLARSFFSVLSVCLSRVLHSTACCQPCFRRLLWQLLYLPGIQWPFQQLLRAPRLRFQMILQPLCPHVFRQCAPSFIAVLCARNLTARSPVWLFPQLQRCFPLYFQFRLGSYQLTFLSYRYIEIAAIS